MNEDGIYRKKRHKFRRKRPGHFRKTVSFVLFFAVLAALAYGLLGHFGASDAQFTPQPTATQANGFITISACPYPPTCRDQPTAVPENAFQGNSSNLIGAADHRKTTWNLILINKWNPIPEDYDVDLTHLSNGQSVDTRIYPTLQEMFDVAKIDGVYLVVAEGYRTAQKQQSLMDEKIAELEAKGRSAADAQQEAETWVALPGTSEHQIGIAVDINSDAIHSTGSKVYEWLGKNAWKYGFILRYPSDKTAITGVSYEPWHYRYVGKEPAEQICRQGLCLEEYLKAIR